MTPAASESAAADDYVNTWEAEELTLVEARKCGVKVPMAVEVAWENDYGPSKETPEERYARVLRWVEKRVLPTGGSAREEIT